MLEKTERDYMTARKSQSEVLQTLQVKVTGTASESDLDEQDVNSKQCIELEK